MTHTEFRQTRTFASLDGLRCLSIVAVVWHHSRGTEPTFRALTLGFLGVDLFFVISGFLITTLLLRERDATGRISLRSFYLRRSLRIFPLYYGLILALTFFFSLIHTNSDFGRRIVPELWVYILYLGDFIPVSFGLVWSLAVEEQFYAVWPAVEKSMTRWIVPILIILLIVNQLINFPTSRQWLNDMFGLSGKWMSREVAQVTFTPILLGVSLAHCLHSPIGYNRLGRALSLTKSWAPLLPALVILVLLLLAPEDIGGLPRLSLQVAFTWLLAACVFRERHALYGLLTLPLVRRIGVVSYGIYLLHIIAIAITVNLLGKLGVQPVVLVFATSLFISVTLAEISFRIWETPFLRLKNRFVPARDVPVEAPIMRVSPPAHNNESAE